MSESQYSKRDRAIATPHAGVGSHRYELYSRAWQRIEFAAAAGFHLEAITLIESLLTDRLESRASYLTGRNEGFKNLRPLILIFEAKETVASFRELIIAIDSWRHHRNHALHEMVKFETDTFPTWEQQTAHLPEIVREGQRLLWEFAELDSIEREKNNVRPPATWPNAFGQKPGDIRVAKPGGRGAETRTDRARDMRKAARRKTGDA